MASIMHLDPDHPAVLPQESSGQTENLINISDSHLSGRTEEPDHEATKQIGNLAQSLDLSFKTEVGNSTNNTDSHSNGSHFGATEIGSIVGIFLLLVACGVLKMYINKSSSPKRYDPLVDIEI